MFWDFVRGVDVHSTPNHSPTISISVNWKSAPEVSTGSRALPATPPLLHRNWRFLIDVSTFLHLPKFVAILDTQLRRIPPLLQASRSVSPSSLLPLVEKIWNFGQSKLHLNSSPARRAIIKGFIVICRSFCSSSVISFIVSLDSFIIGQDLSFVGQDSLIIGQDSIIFGQDSSISGQIAAFSFIFRITSFDFGGHTGRIIISIYYGGKFSRNFTGG